MKTKEELNELKEEVIMLKRKLAELTEEELQMVVGGTAMPGMDDHEKYVTGNNSGFEIPDSQNQNKYAPDIYFVDPKNKWGE